MMAPAQLGKATVKRYITSAATGSDRVLAVDSSGDIGVHASILILSLQRCKSGCAAAKLQLPNQSQTNVNGE